MFVQGILMILRLVETWLRAGPPNTPQVGDKARERLCQSLRRLILTTLHSCNVFLYRYVYVGLIEWAATAR